MNNNRIQFSLNFIKKNKPIVFRNFIKNLIQLIFLYFDLRPVNYQLFNLLKDECIGRIGYFYYLLLEIDHISLWGDFSYEVSLKEGI